MGWIPTYGVLPPANISQTVTPNDHYEWKMIKMESEKIIIQAAELTDIYHITGVGTGGTGGLCLRNCAKLPRLPISVLRGWGHPGHPCITV